MLCFLVGSVLRFVVLPYYRRNSPKYKSHSFLTDSPTSQHCKKSLYIIAHHEELFGISAAWNYFEAGHGKGPCDGVGGTTKRTTDDAVKQRKFIILDVYVFYSWA